LVWAVPYYTLPTVSDSKGNTGVALTNVAGASDPQIKLFYVKNPIVGSGHTFTFTGVDNYSPFAVLAFSGTDTTSNVDQENGAGGSSPLAPGSITPTADNEVIVAAIGGHQSSVSIDSGFTLTINGANAANYGVALAYKVQTTAAAVNPTFTASGTGTGMAATIASFKAAAAAAAFKPWFHARSHQVIGSPR